MKPKNFPAKKAMRRLVAQKADLLSFESVATLQRERNVRTKKDRFGKGKVTR